MSHQITPWDKTKYFWKITFSFEAISHKPVFTQQDVSPCALSQMGTTSSCSQISLPRNNFSLGSLDSIECFNKAVRIPVSQRERRENRARCLVSFVTVFKTLYASTPNSCLYLPLYHSINCYCSCIVMEVWTGL